jgi:hypothetical protein
MSRKGNLYGLKATIDQAFRVFTEGIDTWWPRSHHIGKALMEKVILGGRSGGRCYNKQIDGTECDWGSMLVWDPPRRFAMAWKISPNWLYEPELAKSSEVEVSFTPEANGFTRVDLEHRHFERHGAGADAMRTAVDHPDGWNGLLALFRIQVEQAS